VDKHPTGNEAFFAPGPARWLRFVTATLVACILMAAAAAELVRAAEGIRTTDLVKASDSNGGSAAACAKGERLSATVR
jgi:hypothetical protein